MPSLKDLIPEIEEKSETKGSFGGELINVPRISTGILELDLAIGGGFPRGRITEIYGAEGGGKTNLVLGGIREAQILEPKMRQAVLDPEGTWDPLWAARWGIDNDRIYVIRPDFAEQISDAMQLLCTADDLNVIALDSLGSMNPKGEIEDDTTKQHYGGAAKPIKRMTQKTVVELNRRRNAGAPAPAVLWINQIRANFDAGPYGNPEKTTGGKSPMFAYSLRLRVYSSPIIDTKVSKTLPVMKETSIAVKKYKVPVTALAVKYKLAVQDYKDLKVGEVDSWHTVENILKSQGVLTQLPKGKGWTMYGEDYKILKDIRAKFREDPVFKHAIMEGLVGAAVSESGFVEGDEPFDPVTGELSPSA